MKTEYEVGDKAWIHIGGRDNPLIETTVVATVKVPGWWCIHYICEYPTHIDSMLEIRDALAMSEDAKGPIGLWRQFRERRKNELEDR